MITSNNNDGSHEASENCFESCNIDAGWSDKTGLKSKKFSQTELEAFRKPFKLGWKREIVLRSTHTNSGKRIVDIYYFSPEKNVKLRSYVEIGLYLNRHPECDLEPENFTFARQPIFREPFEIIRQANPRTRNENSEVTTPNHHQRSRTRSERMDKSERTDKLEKVEKSTEKSEKDQSKDPNDDNDIIVDSFNESIPDEIFQNIPTMIPPMEGEDDYLGIVSHEEITRGTHEMPRKRLKTVETASSHRSDQTNNVDSNNHIESVKTTGVNGGLSNDIYNHSSSTTQPSDDNGFDASANSKKKTKSKFEKPSKPDSTPKVVKLDLNESEKSKIMNGVSSEGINHNDFETPRSRVEPDGKYSQSKKKKKSKSSAKLDKLKSDKKIILTKSLPKKDTDFTENYENYADDFLHCSFSVTPLASPDNTRYVAPSKIYRTESCDNRLITNSSKSRSKQSDKHGKIEKRAKKDKNDSEKDIVDCIIDSIPEEILNNLPPMLHPTPCSIMCFGKKGIIPTLLCDRCLCLYHPECVPAGIFLDNSHSFICPNCIHPNDAGETVGFMNGRLMGDSEALAIGYHDHSVLFKRRRKASIENRILGHPVAPIAPIVYSASQIAEFLNTKINKCRKHLNRIKPEFNLLSSGYECLNQIFQHLSTRDLIKVKLTSRTFNRLASQPMLWQEITMKDMIIKDWQYFGRNIVEPMATQSINFDGIKCPPGSDLSEMWSNFSTITDYLKSIKHIQFGTVPTSVIEEIINAAVTENCYNSFSNLETLSVRHLFEDDSAFQSCNLSILENIAYLSSLQHLRVDCKYGLIVNPEDSDLLDRIFAPMTNLKSLSMTTLKGFTVDQFSFLSHLQTLSSLEIGSCLNWANHDVKSYSSLSSSPPSPPSPSYSQEKLDHYETIEQFEDEAIVTDANLDCIVSETLNDVSGDVAEVEIEGEVDCEIELESAENETKNEVNNQIKLKGVYRHLSKLTSLRHLKLVDLTINDTCNSMPLSLQGMTKLRSLQLENLIVLPDASQTLILLASTVNNYLKNLKDLIISSNDPYTNKCVLSTLKKIDKLENITWKVQVNVEDNGQCWVPILKESGEESELEEDIFDLAGEDRLEMMDLDQLSQIIERHTLGATVNIIPQ